MSILKVVKKFELVWTKGAFNVNKNGIINWFICIMCPAFVT